MNADRTAVAFIALDRAGTIVGKPSLIYLQICARLSAQDTLSCHRERSEGSHRVCHGHEILRCAQDDSRGE